MKKGLVGVILLMILFCTAACGEKKIDSLTYAVYPYLPDPEYYQDLIEERWSELEPDISLVRAEWNCYHDGEPEGIDVVIYDAALRDTLISEGWIQPIDLSAVNDAEDIFPYALEGLTND